MAVQVEAFETYIQACIAAGFCDNVLLLHVDQSDHH